MFLVFLALAAILSAVRDTTQDHFSTSVFKDKDPQWWNHEISWKNEGFVWFKDAWHMAKAGELLFVSLAIVSYRPIFGWLDLVLCFLLWWGSFELFYSKLLIKDQEKI